jgi:hypothetical protein
MTETDPAAVGDHHDFVVEGIVDIGQALIGAGGGLIDLGRTLHAQGFVRALVVEDIDEVIELGLLLQEVRTGRLGGFFLQGQMHALMAAVLLRMTRPDPFNPNPQAQPPNRQFAQVE